ncbi:carboxypeptidase-like regulatory domain-containing protein [Croceivirga thetidis]|uniref:Carboxypeptidase-like regulatory domain-containing protein n=1 Tax=Croceivirga thetidis TaxID=2721623 RepID=A0ABX1GM66_9FLAO|nr:carboxypeptidase-like regulatory domain-containing protein [Croceivirga thetidis]NKI30998.1 carboxypeptidase-like regulatory domain-containing protein [Croceivirga thetidis]
MQKILFFLVLLIGVTAMGQKNGHITGQVLDSQMNGEPLLFANITLKNSSFETQSNFHGNFELANIESGDYTLIITALGYERIEVPVKIEAGKTLRIAREMKPLSITTTGIVVTASAEENSAESKERIYFNSRQ